MSSSSASPHVYPRAPFTQQSLFPFVFYPKRRWTQTGFRKFIRRQVGCPPLGADGESGPRSLPALGRPPSVGQAPPAGAEPPASRRSPSVGQAPQHRVNLQHHADPPALGRPPNVGQVPQHRANPQLGQNPRHQADQGLTGPHRAANVAPAQPRRAPWSLAKHLRVFSSSFIHVLLFEVLNPPRGWKQTPLPSPPWPATLASNGMLGFEPAAKCSLHPLNKRNCASNNCLGDSVHLPLGCQPPFSGGCSPVTVMVSCSGATEMCHPFTGFFTPWACTPLLLQAQLPSFLDSCIPAGRAGKLQASPSENVSPSLWNDGLAG